jgi:hypothetical protein
VFGERLDGRMEADPIHPSNTVEINDATTPLARMDDGGFRASLFGRLKATPNFHSTTVEINGDSFVFGRTNDAEGLTTVSLGKTIGTIANGSGWPSRDPMLLETIRVANEQAPGIRLSFGTTEDGRAFADVAMKQPDTIHIAKRAVWDKLAGTVQDCHDDGYFMSEASGMNAVRYVVSHEMGHVSHARFEGGNFRSGSIAVANELGRLTSRSGWSFVDENEKMTENSAQVLRDLGMSRYGATDIYELIAEAHASWILGGRSEVVRTIAGVLGWGQ